MESLFLFPPWVQRLSRKDPNKRYYYNTQTLEVCGKRCDLPSSAYASTDKVSSQMAEDTHLTPVLAEVDEIFLQDGVPTIQKKKSFLEQNGYKHLFSTKKCDFWGCRKQDGFVYETRKKIDEPLQKIIKQSVMSLKHNLKPKVLCRKKLKDGFVYETRKKIDEPLQKIIKESVMSLKHNLKPKVLCRKKLKEAFEARGRSKNKSTSDDDSDYVPGR